MPPAAPAPWRPARLLPWVIAGLVWLGSALLLWPGWLFNDSAVQWSWAQELAAGAPSTASTQWPALMTLVKVPFAGPDPWLGLFGALQAAAVLGSLVWLAVGVCPAGLRRSLLVVAALVCPVTWNYAWLHSSDAPALAAMAAVLGVLARGERLGVAIPSLAVIAGLRYDGVLVAAVLAVVLLLRGRGPTRALPAPLRLAAAAGVAIAVAGPPLANGALARRLGARPLHTELPGLALTAWHTGALSSLEPQLATERQRLLLRELAQRPVPAVCLEEGMWCEPFGAFRDEVVDGLDRDALLRALAARAVEAPRPSAVALTQRSLRQLGLSTPLSSAEIGRYDGPQRDLYDQEPTPSRALASRALRATEGAAAGVLVRPWLWLPALLLPLLGSAPQRRASQALLVAWVAFLLAATVVSPFADLRYQLLFLLPAWILVPSAALERWGGARGAS